MESFAENGGFEEETLKRSGDAAEVEGDEAANKRHAGGADGEPAPEDGAVSVRFLLPNASAGSVIGKGGATISEFQAQSSARIQLSRNGEFFPGTADRILLLVGSINAILIIAQASPLLAAGPARAQPSTAAR